MLRPDHLSRKFQRRPTKSAQAFAEATGPSEHTVMTPRRQTSSHAFLRCHLGLGGALLLAGLGCSKAHGPFGYSHHPYAHPQIETMLGDFPNPGPNVLTLMRDQTGAIVVPPKEPEPYAMELVAFEPGRPAAIVEGSDPREALGLPNYSTNEREMPHALSLGNGGVLTLKLLGDPLIDQPGPDLFVFEAGPSPEAVAVEISFDGATWTSVGEAAGGPRALDISPFVKPTEMFRFIRLTDVRDSGGDSEPWPGAEIDAVAARRGLPPALPEPERIDIPNEVLFGFDSDALAAAAPSALDRVVTRMAERPSAALTIFGHTDDIGDDAYNLDLSDRRARAVRTYLIGRGIAASRINAAGVGETRPAVPNDSDEARRQNRRVELTLIEQR